ncbi:hypothetical protein V9T40_011172 [Parthenolecanium corni]|uniref:PDZ domain-containing protein n=1 Tax=Parthenolecanium corni TaxID=536013 RepID=A0AAN9T6I4_9HEMI
MTKPGLEYHYDSVSHTVSTPLFAAEVHPNSFCSQYLSPEDRIIRIEGIDVELLSEAEALSFVTKPGRSLNLLIHKRSPTICHQHNPGDDGSSESSTSSSSTALRHDNLRSSFRSYFHRKYDAHHGSPDSPSSRRIPPDAQQTPPSPRFASRWSRDPTETPPNADLRTNRGVHWWDTGASSSSYSSSALEDSENERSYDEFRLGPDDEVDFGGGWGDRNQSPKGLATGSSNESVSTNSKDMSARETHRVVSPSTPGEPSLQTKSRKVYTVRSVRSDDDEKRNISRVYLSPFGAKINLNDPNISRNFDQIG